MKPINRSGQQKTKTQAARTTSISLPFWDDFSQSGPAPDTLLWQHGEDVFVNNTLGIAPPSLNVATFDGARADGQPHNASEEVPGAADSLVSCPINLAEVVPSKRSTVLFSFWWQIKGAGEIPEENDSIRLQFLDSANSWHTVWSADGASANNDSTFLNTSIVVADVDGIPDSIFFFHDQFQFKFQIFSSLRGIFDTWHIDYVYLNQDRSVFDRIFDRAAANQPGPLFGPYHHLPMVQYRDSALFSAQEVVLNNLDIGAPHPFSYTQSLINTLNDTILRTVNFTNRLLTNGASGSFQGFGNVTPDLLLADSLFITSEFVFFTGDRNLFEEINSDGDTLFFDVDLKVNDTVRSFHSLHETLAYDDGSAEFAAGINLDRGQLAVRYALATQDTLTHLQVYFPSLPSTSGQAITLKVWDELSDEGEKATKQFNIESTGQNVFTEVQLNRPIIVNDTFFIGFEQFTDEYIGVGLDRSNDQASDDLFFNVNREWQQNVEIDGALMIRPVFRNTSDVVLHASAPQTEKIILYPNPAKNTLNSAALFEKLEIYNLSGQLMFATPYASDINISPLPNGIYLVRVYNKNTVQITKLIIQK